MLLQVETNPFSERPWDKYIEAGKDILKGQESSFHRPMIKKDRLFYTKPDGSVIQVEHPRPTGFAARNYKEGWTNVRFVHSDDVSVRVILISFQFKLEMLTAEILIKNLAESRIQILLY